MIQILGVLLTIVAATGLVIIWDWMIGAYTYVRARLRASASPHARDGDRRSLEDETRRQWDNDDDEDLFV